MIIHYNCTKQFLVALVFADLPSLSFHEMTCSTLTCGETRAPLRAVIRTYVRTRTYGKRNVS